MKDSLKRAFKIYKYLSLVFSVIYWIYVVIDDYVFIEEYWDTHWLEYLGIWILYFLTYFLAFSLYFWIAALIVILVYLNVVKRKKNISGY